MVADSQSRAGSLKVKPCSCSRCVLKRTLQVYKTPPALTNCLLFVGGVGSGGAWEVRVVSSRTMPLTELARPRLLHSYLTGLTRQLFPYTSCLLDPRITRHWSPSSSTRCPEGGQVGRGRAPLAPVMWTQVLVLYWGTPLTTEEAFPTDDPPVGGL